MKVRKLWGIRGLAMCLAVVLGVMEMAPLMARAEVRDESTYDSAVAGTDKTYYRTVATNYHAGNILGMVSVTSADDMAKAFGITDKQKGQGYEPVLYINSFPWASYERRLAEKTAGEFGGTVVTMTELRLFRWEASAYAETDKTASPFKMIMGIPEKAHNEKGDEYVVIPDTYNRDFAVIRVYKDEVTVLKDLDTDKKTLTFETDKRGALALVFAPEGAIDQYLKDLAAAQKAAQKAAAKTKKARR